jgi:SAM-dependent methyltransferase
MTTSETAMPRLTPSTPKPKTKPKRPMNIALPEPNLSMDQDAEWCVIELDGKWRRVRFHDYDEIYRVPGLYERLFYKILQCQSPTVVRKLLEKELRDEGFNPKKLRALDLGAGNGMVGEQLAEMGAEPIVGADIIPEAADAARRDRPHVYEEYFVEDFTRLSSASRERLRTFRFNCLTCVAALGFGDIPTRAFAEAYNLVADDGWLAFNIKEDFLDVRDDDTGFSRLIRESKEAGIITIRAEERYRHRIATNGDPLYYVAVVANKNRDIPEELVE